MMNLKFSIAERMAALVYIAQRWTDHTPRLWFDEVAAQLSVAPERLYDMARPGRDASTPAETWVLACRVAHLSDPLAAQKILDWFSARIGMSRTLIGFSALPMPQGAAQIARTVKRAFAEWVNIARGPASSASRLTMAEVGARVGLGKTTLYDYTDEDSDKSIPTETLLMVAAWAHNVKPAEAMAQAAMLLYICADGAYVPSGERAAANTEAAHS